MRLEFVKLPNRLFYGVGEKESYIKECGDFNIITTMIYLYSSNDYFGNSVFTLEELILFTGAKSIGRHKGENLDRMKELLKYMIDKKLIYFDGDISKVKVKEIIKCKINFFDSVDYDGEPYGYGFVKLPVKVIDKLLAYDGKGDKIKLLFYWSYIHCRRYKKLEGITTNNRESCTWVSFDKINDDLGISEHTINTYNKTLVNLKLLLIHNSGYLVKGKEVKSANNIYVTVDEDLETAEMYMKESISRYEYKRRQEGYRISKCSPEEKKVKKERKVQEEPNCVEPEIEQEKEAEITNYLDRLFG